MQQTIKTITKEQTEEIKRIASMFGYDDLTFYHGDVTVSFKTTSLSPLEVQYLKSAGMKLGGIDCFISQKSNLPYMRVCIEVIN